MSRPSKVVCLCGRIGQHATGEAAVVCGDAGGDCGVNGVDCDGVGGLVWVCVVGDHLREVEGCGAGDGQRSAEVAGRIPDHEGGFFGREGRGRNDEVAFVFARGRVEHNYEFVVCCERAREGGLVWWGE